MMANFGERSLPNHSGMEYKLRTMKKVLLVLVAVFFTSIVMTSCGSAHSCPAYGKVTNVTPEKRG